MQLLIDHAGKRYGGDFWGLREFTLDLGPGVVGILGPNGAGKSTLMRMLATITRPTEGRITWNGEDTARKPDPLREVLGYLPQEFGVYPNLTPVEFLEYLSAVKGLGARHARRRIAELLDFLGLGSHRDRRLGGFSGGMKQRVGIAQALLNDPKLLIVDEPTAGLDPEERIRFRSLLSALAGERIVLLSTHIVSDLESIATRIAILNRGRLVSDATPEWLLSRVAHRVWEWVIPSEEVAAARQRHVIGAAVRRSNGICVRVVSDSPPAESAQPAQAALEDAYLHFISADRAEAER